MEESKESSRSARPAEAHGTRPRQAEPSGDPPANSHFDHACLIFGGQGGTNKARHACVRTGDASKTPWARKLPPAHRVLLSCGQTMETHTSFNRCVGQIGTTGRFIERTRVRCKTSAEQFLFFTHADVRRWICHTVVGCENGGPALPIRQKLINLTISCDVTGLLFCDV